MPKKFISYLFALILIGAGIMHFVSPTFYFAMIPAVFPPLATVYISGIVEILLGVGLLLPRYQSLAAFGTLVLMVLFLPVHVWDYLKDAPAIGSHLVAGIRILIQFVFIFWAWRIRKMYIGG
jgi:uncharacterized membrane protein